MTVVWPAEVYRAVIADQRDRADRAEAALDRARSCITDWTDHASRWPDDLGRKATGLDPATLRACAAALAGRIQGDPDA